LIVQSSKDILTMDIKYLMIMPRQFFSPITMILVAVMGLFLISCEENDYGTPEITHLRITDPAKADSTFSAGSLGQKIVIMGRNLGSAQHIYFNNVEAYVNPNYVTDGNIILDIPTGVPTELNNMITVVTLGGTATYPFQVEIPGPIISKVSLEIVKGGDAITITGDYFFSSEVTIGGAAAEVVSEKQKELVVTVPASTGDGILHIKTLFGESDYQYKINDMGKILIDWEDASTRDCWWKLNWIREDTENPPVPLLSGSYGNVETENMGQTGWFDPGVITTCGSANMSGSLANSAMKMEINLPEAIQAGYYNLSIGGSWSYKLNLWASAPYKTAGWVTVTIPMSEFKDSGGSPLTDASKVGDLQFVFKIDGASETNPKFKWNIDNVRIVNML
jgi:Surface glycan-binding protein B xyloglucan binding domain/IPT/TIG domain